MYRFATLTLLGSLLAAQSLAGVPWPQQLPATARRLGAPFLRKADAPTRLTYSPDGRILWSEALRTTVGWSLADGERLRLFAEHIEIAAMPRFGRDGSLVALRLHKARGVVCLDAATGESVLDVDAGTSDITCFALSPDGRYLAFGSCKRDDRGPSISRYAHSVVVWDVAAKQKVMHERLPGRHDFVHDIVFSPESRLLAALSSDGFGTVRVFDLDQLEQIREQKIGSVHPMRFVDAQLQVGLAGRLDTATGGWLPHEALPLELAWPYELSHDGRYLAGICESPSGSPKVGRVAIVDLQTNTVHKLLGGHHERVACLAFSPDGSELATGASDGRTLRWDLATGRAIEPGQGHWTTVTGVVWSPNGQWIASCDDAGELFVWNARSGEVEQHLHRDARALRHLSVSGDGHTLAVAAATADSDCVWLLETATWALRTRIPGFGPSCRSVTISHSGSWLVGIDTNEGHLHDLAKDERTRFAPLTFYPSANAIKTHTGGVFTLRDVDTGEQIGTGEPPTLADAWDCTRDGRFVVGGSFWHVQVRDSSAYYLMDPLPDQVSVMQARFSPDGTRLAAATSDGELRIYGRDPISSQFAEIGRCHAPSGRLHDLAFSPDGKHVVTGGLAGSVVVWSVP